jgi:DNA polymerase-3 subunit alpha
MNFPQLQTYTSYSLLDSLIGIKEYVQIGKERGYQTLGIMDKNVLYGALEFVQEAKKNQVQAIVGLDLTYYNESLNQEFSLLLIAKDYKGYQELMRLSSQKMTEISENLLQLKDILPISNHVAVLFNEKSELSTMEVSQSQKWVKQFNEIEDRYLVVNAGTNVSWLSLAEELGLRPLALNEVRYFKSEEHFALEVAQAVRKQEIIHLAETETMGKYFLQSQQEAVDRLEKAGFQVALENAENLVETIDFDIPVNQKLLPQYPLDGQNAGEFLRKLAFEKLPGRVETVTSEYIERLEMELDVIHEMGFDDYFLIVWDLLDYAHRMDIFTGAGRGSAAGSLVAFALSITGVDPIKYDLLFERFLNKERYTMPDIDIDIPDNKRQDILQYVGEKYGKHHVAQIATFGTLAAKQVLRDVARVFGLSQSEANQWSKAIPNELKITLQDAYKKSKRLRDLIELSPRNQKLFEVALELEGMPRNVSTHAAGVVISDKDLYDLIPLQTGSNDILLTQFTMYDVEKIGLLKMDFLGLKNLSIIDNAVHSVKRVYNVDLDLKQLDLADPATLKLFRKGETTGVFQFESSGIRNVLRKLSPTSIEDIVAVNALYRPGPMQNIDSFVNRKHGKEKIVYPDDSLQPILKNTYGIMVYQEQVMQVLVKMADFTLGQADIVRRAIGKKKKDVIDEEREHFVQGALKQGYKEQVAVQVYDYIEKFANYGFNRSHAFAYSFVGFQMGYLKVHYPGAFFVALLHANRTNRSKLKEYVAEAKKYQVQVLAPDINKSGYSFQLLNPQEIRFGFSSIKGIRGDFIQDVLEERKENGRFKDFDSFLFRLDKKWLKEDYLKPLIMTGAFDEVEPNRKKLFDGLEASIQNILLFGGTPDLLTEFATVELKITDYSLEEKLAAEEEYLGTYLSGYPTEQYQKLKIAKQVTDIHQLFENTKAHVLGYVREIRTIRTKKGESMAFVEIGDTSGEISLTLFPGTYRKVMPWLKAGQVIYVEGKVEKSTYREEPQMVVQLIQLAEQANVSISTETLFLRLEDESHSETLIDLLKKNHGSIPVILYFVKSGKKLVLGKELWIRKTAELEEKLTDFFGKENVVFKE